MALPPNGAISTDMIMNELGVAIQPREWGALWALARVGSIPKNKVTAGQPLVLPNDWWGYSNTPPADTTPPNAFTLTAGAVTTSSLAFSWTNTGDNVGVVGYRVFRNGSVIANLGVVTTYTDSGLALSTTPPAYSYYVQAYDAAGNVTNSNTISMTQTAVVAYHYYFSSLSQSTAPISCATDNTGATVIFVYANTNTGLVVGQKLYTDLLVTPFDGQNKYWGILNGDVIVAGTKSPFSYKIAPDGTILDIVNCATLPFTPYSYSGTIRSVSAGPSFQFKFEITIDVFGAPAWNAITGGTVTINQGSSNTNGITNIMHVSGTLYQCQTVVNVVSNTVNASVTLCNIGVSNGSTTHTHTFAVPVTFTPTEIGIGASKSVTVNVT